MAKDVKEYQGIRAVTPKETTFEREQERIRAAKELKAAVKPMDVEDWKSMSPLERAKRILECHQLAHEMADQWADADLADLFKGEPQKKEK
jgi:hypothetical protein